MRKFLGISLIPIQITTQLKTEKSAYTSVTAAHKKPRVYLSTPKSKAGRKIKKLEFALFFPHDHHFLWPTFYSCENRHDSQVRSCSTSTHLASQFILNLTRYYCDDLLTWSQNVSHSSSHFCCSTEELHFTKSSLTFYSAYIISPGFVPKSAAVTIIHFALSQRRAEDVVD